MTSEKPLQLHLGWHFPDTSKPLLFDFGKLRYHGAILAQSGAGKSFLVGRLVEELLVKTLARVVVIDTNADFRKAYEMDPSPKPEIAEMLIDDVRLAHGFEPAEFAKRLRGVSKTYLTNQPSESREGVEFKVPYVSWDKLPRPFQMEVLGLELSRSPDEVAALYRIDQRLWDEDPGNVVISPAIMDKELDLLASTSTNRLSESTIVSLQLRFRQAKQLNLWREEADQFDVSHYFEQEPNPRLLVLDVPAVAQIARPSQSGGPAADRKRALILVGYLLEVLWKRALREWDDAMANPSKKVKRLPTFLVIDEAHNFVPFDVPLDPLALRISDLIQRIAAEGRKYGLFLLLATQRPPKIRPGLLQECENVCLLRLQSPIDRELSREIWGISKKYLEPGNPTTIANFQKGHGLLFGHWSEGQNGEASEIIFRAGPRRTKETGGDLRDGDWILTR